MVEMAFNDVNLLEMLFPDHDTDDANNSDDIGRLRMKEIFNAEFNDIMTLNHKIHRSHAMIIHL